MRKYNIVKENKEFEDIITSGFQKKNDFYVIYFKNNELDHYRFGISVGKKIGNAVIRNKIKRQLRNIIDKNKKIYQNSKDYIIIVRKNCLNKSYTELEEKFLEIVQ